MMQETGIQLNELELESPDLPFGLGSGAAVIYGTTGGVAEAVVRHCLPDKSKNALREISILGLRGDALACLRQMNLLDMLSAPTEKLFVSFSLSGSDGAAQRPAAWLKLMKRLFPALSEGDGKRLSDAWYARGAAMDALGQALRAAQVSHRAKGKCVRLGRAVGQRASFAGHA